MTPTIENQRLRLEGWKEIAAYLKVHQRTAIRWEGQRGLPVRRIPGGQRNAVFAHSSEIDAWLSQTAPEDLAPRTGPQSETPVQRWKPWAVGLVALVGLIATVSVSRSPGPIATATLSDTKLLAWDKDGKLLWEYLFPQPLGKPDGNWIPERVRIIDLDGDGQPEVLAFVGLAGQKDPGHPAEVDCFTSKGKLLWSYRPEMTLSFSGVPFGGPWHFSDVLITPGRKPANVWLAVVHHTWWPSFLVKLDFEGKASVLFVNPGSIYKLNYTRTGQGNFVLGAGVNNAYDAAALIVLQEDQPPAAAPPALKKEFVCDRCPAGRPYRYFLFPPSELHSLVPGTAPYNAAKSVEVFNGHISFRTYEFLTDSDGMDGIFDLNLTPDIEPVAFAFSDSYWQRHRVLESEGKVHHTAALCRDRKAKTILRWDAESGRRDIVVPSIGMQSQAQVRHD